ncbi:MAG: acetylornithine/succinylornithine family transaminase [Ruminococcaceae bacterium]|nr:acetylornithine/succinylornithine family transaminase [Oscillospiraceae bacterium]
MTDIRELDRAYVAPTYNRFPVVIESGKGSVVIDDAGKEYIDMGSGIAVTSFGIADEEWASAVSAQLLRVQHTSNLYYTAPCAELARELCTRTGLKKVFFSNSGAEANECAIKAARKYAAEKKGAEYYTIVTLENSFHGRTLTTLAATGQTHYHELFRPLTPGFVHTPANDAEALIATARAHKAAGIMLECVQGEGGVNRLDPDFVTRVAAFAKEEDIVLIIDEVQTGNGRTGELYAFMHYGITPDVVTTAKGLGGGLPIGATMLGEKVESVFSYGDHGSTFGGNPVAAAGALNILSRIDERMLLEVREKSAYIFGRLSGAEGIRSVSGMGLMIGVETEKSASDVVRGCMERGVLVLTAKAKVRLLPALNIPYDVLEKAIDVILSVCAE